MNQTITIDGEDYEVDRTVAGHIDDMQTEIEMLRLKRDEQEMTCDTCKRQMNYCFYINDEYWDKVMKKPEGYQCAHCILEKLGGLEWYIVWNEPSEKIMHNSSNSPARGRP